MEVGRVSVDLSGKMGLPGNDTDITRAHKASSEVGGEAHEAATRSGADGTLCEEKTAGDYIVDETTPIIPPALRSALEGVHEDVLLPKRAMGPGFAVHTRHSYRPVCSLGVPS